MIMKILFSFLFALMMTFDQMIVTGDPEVEIFTDIKSNYMIPATGFTILTFICSFIGMFVLFTLANKLATRLEEKTLLSYTQGINPVVVADKINPKLFLIFTIVIATCWLPYLLSNIPGGVFYDNYYVYDMVWGRQPMANQQPILYTLIHVFLFKVIVGVFGGTMQAVVMTMTLIQYITFAIGLSWFLCWMKKRNVSKIYIGIVLIFFSLFPLFPSYAITNWKDTLFSLFLFLFSIVIADLVLDGVKRFSDHNWIIRYLILAFLICFFRNNGIYIIIATTVILFICYRKYIFKNKYRKYSFTSMLLIIVTLIVQGPIFDSIGYNEVQAVEMNGIPLQQVSFVILSGGDVSDDEIEFIDNIISPDIREVYFSPNGIDPMKRTIDESSQQFLADHQDEFLRIWFNIVSRNPKLAIEAYLFATMGFWNINKSSSHGYIQTNLSPGWEWQGITPVDLIDELTGFSIYYRLLPKFYISAALFGWIMLFCFVLILLRKKCYLLLPFVPMLTLWATIMVSTPISYSLRYVFVFVIFMPLAFLLAFLYRYQLKPDTN